MSLNESVFMFDVLASLGSFYRHHLATAAAFVMLTVLTYWDDFEATVNNGATKQLSVYCVLFSWKKTFFAFCFSIFFKIQVCGVNLNPICT